MRRGGGIGIPQDCWPKAGFEIDRISLVAFQCAVEVEGATRPGTCHNRDSWALAIRTLDGTSGDRGVIRICTEAGLRNDVASAAFLCNSWHGRITTCAAACAALPRSSRISTESHLV